MAIIEHLEEALKNSPRHCGVVAASSCGVKLRYNGKPLEYKSEPKDMPLAG